MTKLAELKRAVNLGDLARVLDYSPRGLSYIVYKMGQVHKYTTFTIPKKYGGQRIIQAPHPKLSLLQKRLAQVLYECVEEHKKDNPRFWFASHGFQKGRTIISNAQAHKNKRFVFNLDLENFFGTINFGRVRGFFIKDKVFALHPAVATVIAQIACYNNELPQGSPCSPVISNLIGNILDLRLLPLARDTRCTYTRYADDLTFSTNKKVFPPEIATETGDGKWEVGKKLHKRIRETRFTINPNKTRMTLKQSRQNVTGLVVNKKANIKQEYYKNARAMCNLLFRTASYYKPYDETKKTTNNLDHLDGTLSHIYFVKGRRDRPLNINKELKKIKDFYPPLGTERLYKKFLFYKYFVAHPVPLIITEGSTDIIYLKNAIRVFSGQFPSLGVANKNGKLKLNIKFLKSSKIKSEILNLSGGTGGQKNLINDYKNNLRKGKYHPIRKQPVIILCDNDKGAEEVFAAVKGQAGITITTKSTEPFYQLFENLYLVKIPEGKRPIQERAIEALFSQKLLNTKLGGKAINLKDDFGKDIFAQQIVSKANNKTDFPGFKTLLTRIQDAINDYNAPKPLPVAPKPPPAKPKTPPITP